MQTSNKLNCAKSLFSIKNINFNQNQILKNNKDKNLLFLLFIKNAKNIIYQKFRIKK